MARPMRTFSPRALPIGAPRLKTPVLPEAGLPRRRALARLMRQRLGPRPELGLDAPAREAQEAARVS